MDAFADDGDNFQTTLNLSLVKTFGENGQHAFMPSLGLTRSEYLENLQDGRVDLVFSAGIEWDLASQGVAEPSGFCQLLQAFHECERRGVALGILKFQGFGTPGFRPP